jgi:DNA-binding transcriptional regulator YiaG
MFEAGVVEAITEELVRLIVQEGEELRPAEVRFLREVLGMTQGELADRLGISRATVNRWEAGDDMVGPINALALRTLAVWNLNDAALAKEIGQPRRLPKTDRVRLPYRLERVAPPGSAARPFV